LTPLRQQSERQAQIDYLSRLLKRALILWDGPRCIGPLTTHDPRLDCSHIYPKGRYPNMRFTQDNVMVQCRTCHEWYGANHQRAAAWIQYVLFKDRYARLQTLLMYPEPGPMDDRW
jgi:hypothetical protein